MSDSGLRIQDAGRNSLAFRAWHLDTGSAAFKGLPTKLVARIATFLLVLSTVSCGDASFDVTTSVISHDATRQISVWSPKEGGPWPIVYALHGLGGNREDLAVMAEELASQGVVVFATDYRTTQPQYIEQDLECGTRYTLSVAEDYGGSLEQPLTFVGHSMGASAVLVGGLNESAYGTDGSFRDCFAGRKMPDVIVGISGCHYEFEGEAYPFDVSGYGNTDAELILIGGTEDQVCAAWQSRDAAADLRSAGYDAEFVEIDGANHFTVIFHDVVDDEWLTVPDAPAGEQVVQTILDAIEAAQG